MYPSTPYLDCMKSADWFKSNLPYNKLRAVFPEVHSPLHFRDLIIAWAEEKAKEAIEKAIPDRSIMPSKSDFEVIEYDPLTAHHDPTTGIYSASWSFEVKPIG